METVRDHKTELRRRYKDLRRQFSLGGGATAGRMVAENLRRLLADYADHQCCLYRARPTEISCLLEPVTDYFFPLMDGEDLSFRRPLQPGAFRSGTLGIAEPVARESVALDPSLPTVVCCPAVALDRAGRRLGMGQGYYDRFFARAPHCLKVGVAFHVQFSSDPLPVESWDQPMDWIVTEKMVLRTQSPTRSS